LVAYNDMVVCKTAAGQQILILGVCQVLRNVLQVRKNHRVLILAIVKVIWNI
jgi:hypothetical protein